MATTPNDERHAPTTNGHVLARDANGADASRLPGWRRVPRSRMGGLWVAAVVFAVVLLLLLIFVLQNGQSAEVSFLGAHGRLPMGVALLLAAIFGVLLVALPGTARILQLRVLSRSPIPRERVSWRPPSRHQPASRSPEPPPSPPSEPTVEGK